MNLLDRNHNLFLYKEISSSLMTCRLYIKSNPVAYSGGLFSFPEIVGHLQKLGQIWILAEG